METLTLKARNYTEQGNYPKAEILLQKAFKLGKETSIDVSEMTAIYLSLAMTMQKQGKYA